jgi:hypothetical protein
MSSGHLPSLEICIQARTSHQLSDAQSLPIEPMIRQNATTYPHIDQSAEEIGTLLPMVMVHITT